MGKGIKTVGGDNAKVCFHLSWRLDFSSFAKCSSTELNSFIFLFTPALKE